MNARAVALVARAAARERAGSLLVLGLLAAAVTGMVGRRTRSAELLRAE